MRRAKCEIIDQKEMIEILKGTSIGRLATLDSEGYPYITPVNFVYYQDCVYFHSGTKGEKIDNLARNPRVCFEVDLPWPIWGSSSTPKRTPAVHTNSIGQSLYVGMPGQYQMENSKPRY